MPYSVIELLNRRQPEINKTIDLTLSRASATGGAYEDGLPDPALNPYFPQASYRTREAAFLKLKRRRPTLAYIRGVDGEVVTDRETVALDINSVGSLGIAKGAVFTEEDFLVMQKIEQLRSTGMADAARELMDVYMTTPARLTLSWLNTLRMLCQRVAVAGKALYTDTRSNIPVELDYTAQIPSGNLATTKTGNGRWSQLTTADGTADLVAHLNAYYANLRQFPAAIALGSTEADNLRSQSSTRIKVARMKGISIDGTTASDANMLPRPTLDEVQQYIASELTSAAQNRGAAPTIIVTDAVYYTRNDDGTYPPPSLFLPAGYYQFMMSGYVEMAIMPTATNNFAGSLAIVNEELSKVPRRERVAVDGCGIPLVADPRWIAARNVENTALT